MSRLKAAARGLVGLLRNGLRSPRDSSRSLDMLPYFVHGAQFSRSAFANQHDTAHGLADSPNALRSYFNAHREGPGIWKWVHYFDIYQRHFSKFVGRDVHVLEVGIYSGGSLPMWKEYFGPRCHIYGVDIEPACMAYQSAGIDVYIGDQSDRCFWAKVRRDVPRLDILIDDGGHETEQQRITLEEMLPHLQPGGVYLCEDIHGDTNRFAGYVQGLASTLHADVSTAVPRGIAGRAVAPNGFQAAIHSIHIYPFVTVIEKREQPLGQLIAPKHGTQWQPFL